MEYNKKGPFIHLFQTPLGYYFYDVNTNQIIKINNDICRNISLNEVSPEYCTVFWGN